MKIFKYGDNVDTDVIIPARYLNITDPAHLAEHCMEDIDQSFCERVIEGDVIVAGDNFGCGSSREHAVIAIKASGVSCVIAKNFARIFFRNALNLGLTIIECEAAVDALTEADEIVVDVEKGEIKRVSDQKVFKFQPYPPFLLNMIQNDGLINTTKKTLKQEAI
ncbi:3-isopropylmalate dehydratase small subunit [Fusibacter ferrireducens]|uniref:3-isopropylmalate dehydratase small subunit n=1 Tax=Fusibacter ferrireducens TaxID=2785058 RepID=A0ABS0A1I4_9FIRM|nr:3-isopropylmalate dehydratase small subunit [Fusibacter ferrireducens]MBF4696000.1 3-isopropylmalate dehydratase small subunit [Fusibacter ferrireducens]